MDKCDHFTKIYKVNFKFYQYLKYALCIIGEYHFYVESMPDVKAQTDTKQHIFSQKNGLKKF